MSYQAVQQQDQEDHPDGSETGRIGSTTSNNAALQNSVAAKGGLGGRQVRRQHAPHHPGRQTNYVHLSDTGNIVGSTFEINTDIPPLYGRFDTREEQTEAANLFLSADEVDVTIKLSGSKPAKIQIKGFSGRVGGYGRTVIRIVNANTQNPSTSSSVHKETFFRLNVTQSPNAACVVAVPEDFSGSITGACFLAGQLRNDASVVVADALKTKWTVFPAGEPPMSESGNQDQEYPPWQEQVPNESNTKKAEAGPNEDEPKHSSIILEASEVQGIIDKTGQTQRDRRCIVYERDFDVGLAHLVHVEKKAKGFTHKMLTIYFGSLFAWYALMWILGSMSDADTSTTVALCIVPTVFTVVFPVIVLVDQWNVYFYKPPERISV